MPKVRFSGSLREIAGRPEVDLALPVPVRLGAVLDYLDTAFPGILGQAAELQWRYGSSHVVVAINGKVVGGRNTDDEYIELADGDVVTLLPPLGGG